MYTPSSFAESNLEKLHDFIQQHSFATLISNTNGLAEATHLPLLLDRTEGKNGTLIGHMARSNPQWQHADDLKVLCIFHGPHTYISPSWYRAKNVVPTWNYVAVHATGSFEIDDSLNRKFEIAKKFVDHYEAAMPAPWSLDQNDSDFIDGMLNAIVCFKIRIEGFEGKWKLNQNQTEERRKGVIRALRAAGGNDQLRIAEMMEATGSDKTGSAPT